MSEFEPIPLTPRPGVVKTESDRVVENRWVDTQWIRFVNGRPQKIGGWTRQTTAIASGVVRAMHAWRDLKSVEYIAAGTYRKLYVYERDFTQHDITPLAKSGTLTNPFTTKAGSNIVEVAHIGHDVNAGTTVIFADAEPVGGVTIDGTYLVSSVVGSGSFNIELETPAASNETGGGTVAYEYEISIGVEHGTYGLGYGVGGYGLYTYGTERPFSTILIEPRVWSLDHFGKMLVGAYNGGSIYVWDPNAVAPSWQRAQKIPDAPTDVRSIFITEERFVMALCENMRVDWCSQGNYNIWAPDETNTANTRNLSEGTKLIAGRPLASHIALVWSDFALYVFQYTGQSSVFSSRLAGRNCGLISPSCAVTANGIAYWMGHTDFYLYNGSVQKIPNVEDIRAYVFGHLRAEDGYLAWGQYLPKHDEVIWVYVALEEEEPSYYVLLNVNDFSWATGRLFRSSGTNFSHGDTRPYLAGYDGHIYLHEDGVDADGHAIETVIELGPVAMANGKANLNIDGINADFEGQAGDLEVRFDAWDRLRNPTIDSQTKIISEADDLVDLRLSGRYVGMTIRSDIAGGYFRFGKPDVLVSSNGTRR
ncbi:MAG TPA: hypothetical protein VNZ94_00595 [Xanthobacteraceae bacterium]|nr:hypothetical protein [Xanthobacteraceae bacterium]